MSRLLFSPRSSISTSTRLTPNTVTLPTLPSIAVFFASANRFGRSAEGVLHISAMVGSPSKDRDCHLRASNIASDSGGQASRRTRVVASLHEFHWVVSIIKLSIRRSLHPRSTLVSPRRTALLRAANLSDAAAAPSSKKPFTALSNSSSGVYGSPTLLRAAAVASSSRFNLSCSKIRSISAGVAVAGHSVEGYRQSDRFNQGGMDAWPLVRVLLRSVSIC